MVMVQINIAIYYYFKSLKMWALRFWAETSRICVRDHSLHTDREISAFIRTDGQNERLVCVETDGQSEIAAFIQMDRQTRTQRLYGQTNRRTWLDRLG